MNKDGVPRGPGGRTLDTTKMMSANRCAQITLRAALKRRGDVLMEPVALAAWLKVLAPGFVDWLAVKVFLEPAIRRGQAGQIEVK